MLSRVKSLAFSTVNRLGYEVIPRWNLFDAPHERYVRRLFDAVKPQTVIDVGANAGQFGQWLRHQCGFQGRIVSFEPIPEMADAVRKAASSDAAWDVMEVALGRQAGTATFNVMAGSQFSSFLSPSADPLSSSSIAVQNTVERKIEVEVATLDDVVGRLGLARPFLKLDTQGFDLEVIAGGEAALKDVVAIQTEVAVQQIYQGAPTFDETTARLGELGFEPSALFPTNDHFPRLVDMDFYFIRRGLLPS